MKERLEHKTEEMIKRENKKWLAIRFAVVSSLISASIIGILLQKPEHEYSTLKSPIPTPKENQQIILHPEYLRGYLAVGYILLTDVDFDGRWDVAERVRAGFTTGDASHKVFFKKGYGPAQSIPDFIKAEYVDEKFFEPYQ
ncbi:hypothetical protein KY348_02900 [Candidatus Woesearchaeota archaeon]|nr:hypothetical protein [Candidatus Woesearchaeota archaeon]